MKRTSEATKGGTADEIAALRAADQRVRDTFGELTVLDDGAVPGLVSSFEATPDGDRWSRVFADIAWIAEEADSGAVGYWRRADPPAVVYLDNEGSTPVGELYLGQTNPHLVELTDGRLLFTGRTLFNNSEAEPEVFDLRTGQSAALPGWEKERERQREALLQHREKRLKRGY